MPILTRPKRQVKTSPIKRRGIKVPIPQNAFGQQHMMAASRRTAAAGQKLSQQLFDFGKKWQADEDTRSAKEALNQFNAQRRTLMYGDPEDQTAVPGYYQSQLGDAVNSAATTEQQLEELRTKLHEGLPTNGARKKFDAAVSQRMFAELEGIRRHYASEGKKAQLAASTSREHLSMQEVSDKWDSDETFDQEWTLIKGELAQRRDLAAWDESIWILELDKSYSRLVESRIEGAIASPNAGLDVAMQMIDRFDADPSVNQDMINKKKLQLKPQIDIHEAQKSLARVQHLPRSQIGKALKEQLGDQPERLDIALRAAERMFSFEDRRKQETITAIQGDLLQEIENGATVDSFFEKRPDALAFIRQNDPGTVAWMHSVEAAHLNRSTYASVNSRTYMSNWAKKSDEEIAEVDLSRDSKYVTEGTYLGLVEDQKRAIARLDPTSDLNKVVSDIQWVVNQDARWNKIFNSAGEDNLIIARAVRKHLESWALKRLDKGLSVNRLTIGDEVSRLSQSTGESVGFMGMLGRDQMIGELLGGEDQAKALKILNAPVEVPALNDSSKSFLQQRIEATKGSPATTEEIQEAWELLNSKENPTRLQELMGKN